MARSTEFCNKRETLYCCRSGGSRRREATRFRRRRTGATIGHCIDGLAIFTRIEGPESCVARVTQALGENDWVHLACHRIPNQKQSFESAFALHDGHFTIERIIQSKLGDPQFTHLSACHTTAGDEESPNEIIYLASAVQFAVFRSVVGTMWAVDDCQTNKITSMFYDNIQDDWTIPVQRSRYTERCK